jgi:putative glutamine amidotransferase
MSGTQASPIVVGVVSSFLSQIRFHAVYEQYLCAILEHTHAVPLIIPCLWELMVRTGRAPESLLEGLDGVLLPGSLSNVHPGRYGAPVEEEAANFDPLRDGTALSMIRAAVSVGVPVLGICRGAQELNCAFGGTLHQQVHRNPGCLDHRAPKNVAQPEKYVPAHPLVVVEGGWLYRLLEREQIADPVLVNSLHGQAVDELGIGVAVEARAPDGVIEAISVPAARALTLGVQWHPEWHTSESPINRSLFKAFNDACARRHLERAEQPLRISRERASAQEMLDASR